MRAHICLATLCIGDALTGCALGPPPKSEEIRTQALPNLSVPSSWTASGAIAGAPSDNWVASFNDPQLSALVEEALAYNTDLQIAAARVEQAAGYARLAGSTIY